MSGDTQSPGDADSKQRELEDLEARMRRLEDELADEQRVEPFRPSGYYTAYYATAGFFLGMVGALTSLLFNVIGSLIFKQDALQLIRVYLTFPLGDQALNFTAEENGLVLAIGCCLYIATGMLLGVPFFVILTRYTQNATFAKRFLLGTILSLIVWIVNFYVILLWLQPTLIDMDPDNLIVRQVPPWVAALTHLVYGWTMVLLYPLGEFVPYQRLMEQTAE